jgi:hypothetical protein
VLALPALLGAAAALALRPTAVVGPRRSG